MTKAGSTLYVFGGSGAAASAPLADITLLDTASLSWTSPTVEGTIPPGRFSHSVVGSAASRMYLFGGMGQMDVLLNDAYEIDTRSTSVVSWRPLVTLGELPEGRQGHTASLIGTSMFVFGGANAQGRLNDVVRLNLDTLRWSRLDSAGAAVPTPRWGHSAMLVSERILIFGGVDQSNNVLSDLWCETPCRSSGARHLAAPASAALTPAAPPACRSMSTACQGEVVLSGSGTLTANDGLYPHLLNCTWHVSPSEAHQQVTLHFSRFALAAGDVVAVYDGASLRRIGMGGRLPPPLTSSSGALRVSFVSDESSTAEGFEASFVSVCAAGYFGTPPVVSCAACRPGTYSLPGQEVCTECAAYHYAAAGASSCNECPALSRAERGSAASWSDCLCLPGSWRPSDSAMACEACPAGAVCLGGGDSEAPPESLPGWCRKGDDYVACCSEDDCPGGAGECPSDATTAAVGESECNTTRYLTMGLLAFVLSLVTLCLVAVCCWSIGFAAGVRKGSRETYKELFAKFKSGSAAQVAFGSLTGPDGSTDVRPEYCTSSVAPSAPPMAVQMLDFEASGNRRASQPPQSPASVGTGRSAQS